MSLKAVYRRSFGLVQALYRDLGYSGTWIRWPVSPMAAELDALPVAIRPRDEAWVVDLDLDSVNGTHWLEFEAKVMSDTSAALQAVGNLRQYAKQVHRQYSALWRAKEGQAVTDSIIELMGQVPRVEIEGEALMGTFGAVLARLRDLEKGRHVLVPESYHHEVVECTGS